MVSLCNTSPCFTAYQGWSQRASIAGNSSAERKVSMMRAHLLQAHQTVSRQSQMWAQTPRKFLHNPRESTDWLQAAELTMMQVWVIATAELSRRGAVHLCPADKDSFVSPKYNEMLLTTLKILPAVFAIR